MQKTIRRAWFTAKRSPTGHSALGQKVPLLSDYLKLLPAPTQRDDIENLKSALVRFPKRVVVLLDEIDRMEKEEIVTLLKVFENRSKSCGMDGLPLIAAT
jgi:hypothetical protein